jgi:hypothetical protein
MWDVSSDPAVQLNACFVEDANDGLADGRWLPPDADLGGREYLFVMASQYSGSEVAQYAAGDLFTVIDAGDFDCMYAMWPRIRPGHDTTELEDGQIFIIEAAKPNVTADIFRFTARKPGDAAGDVVENSLDNIKTFPNPYYSFFPEETDQFERIVYFINLPPRDMTIKIFNIAGDLIRTLEVTPDDITEVDNMSMFSWDLKTDAGLWVAPGIYVWLLEAEGLGSRYGKMAIFTETEQLNTF